MNDSDIIDLLGGTAELARLCKVKLPSVSQWRVRGIPKARRQYLQLLRPDLNWEMEKQGQKEQKEDCKNA